MDKKEGKTSINIINSFPMFAPNSAGFYDVRSLLTVEAINQTFPALTQLASSAGLPMLTLTPIESFGDNSNSDSEMLREMFNAYGSDKGTSHNYHRVYGYILKNRNDIRAVLEIGLGTNNTNIVSNMSKAGKPGASLRAFRDYLTNATIYGADIDRNILFTEKRIKTFYVNQTDPASFLELGKKTPDQYDLIIDDGLHSPHANLYTLTFALEKVRSGGWIVIEDIKIEAVPLWQTVSMLLSSQYESHLLNDAGSLLFCARKIV
jgi:hypothetical protein